MDNKMARGHHSPHLNKKNRENIRRQKAQSVASRFGGTEPTGPLETSVSKAFGEIIRQIREATQEQRREDASILRPAHNSAVDIRLAFHSLDLQQEGFIFKKEQKQNSIELELATRILPAE